MKNTNIAIIGCGNISVQYAQTLKPYPFINIKGVYDIDRSRAEEFAYAHGTSVFDSIDDIIKDPDISIVVNLTIPRVHGEINRRLLVGSKHVYTEKPIAMTYEEAKGIVALVAEKGLMLCSSPITFLGDTQMEAARLLKEDITGKIRLVAAQMHNGMFEKWHPNPSSLYDVGVLYDVGIYPITYITYLFGPAVRVRAFGKVLMPERFDLQDRAFRIKKPDHLYAEIELASGIHFTLNASFLIDYMKRPASVEFVGDKGVLYLGSSLFFRSPLRFAEHFKPYEDVADTSGAYDGIEWCRGLVDMARALDSGTSPKADPYHALHVIEILEAIEKSLNEGIQIDLTSTF